jgi:hypothetical protein
MTRAINSLMGGKCGKTTTKPFDKSPQGEPAGD